jgi:hypothetical protein
MFSRHLDRVCPVVKLQRSGFGEMGSLVDPYLMLASMNGISAVRGREVEMDVSPSDIFENLQFGVMAISEHAKGNWGFGVEVRSSE